MAAVKEFVVMQKGKHAVSLRHRGWLCGKPSDHTCRSSFLGYICKSQKQRMAIR